MPDAKLLTVAERLEHVQERIASAMRRAGRTDEVTLVAVTKLVDVDRIAEAYRAGVRHFGENRVQEFEDKRRLLTLPSAVWHMVGHLQSNKAKRAAELFQTIDSVDSESVAAKLSIAASGPGRRLPVLVQVNVGGEGTKSGVDPDELNRFIETLSRLDALEVRGLMTIPPFLEPAERVRPYFARLRELGEKLGLRELSMGMSHDFEIAIQEGATQVRIGTALFGERPRK
ncbi:MAG: YggS family pyridoxal phosphate-dependent enzyme [Candidatus Acidiferrales bacterium]